MLEDFSPLTGLTLFVVDLGREGRTPTSAALSKVRAALGRLPCPTVAIAAGEGAAPLAPLRDAFDVVLDSEVELAPIADAVRRCPLASMSLVQLLRQGERLDLHEALIAESLVYSVLQSGPEFAAWLAAREGMAPEHEEPEAPVLVERFREVLVLTLNRPHKHNAFSAGMRDALAEGLALALADASIRRVELRGRGASFCSGGDLDEFGSLPDPATAHAIRSTRNVARMLVDLRERVCCEVQGACVGAGAELPAFAGKVVAHEDAFFQLPEVRLGLVPGAGGTASLPRRIGRQRTAWLALSGRRIDAPTAQAWGLVDELRMAPGAQGSGAAGDE